MREVVEIVTKQPGLTSYAVMMQMDADERGGYAAVKRAVDAGLVVKVDRRLFLPTHPGHDLRGVVQLGG